MFDFSNKTWAILLFINFIFSLGFAIKNYSQGNMGWVFIFALLCGVSFTRCLQRMYDAQRESL